MSGWQSWCWKGWGPRPSVGNSQNMDEERWRWVGGDSEDHCGRCAFHQNKGRRGRSERPLRKRYLREGGRENRQGFRGAGVHLRVIFIYILTCSFMTWRMKRGWWRDRDRVGRNVLVTTRQPGRLHRTRGETSRGCRCQVVHQASPWMQRGVRGTWRQIWLGSEPLLITDEIGCGVLYDSTLLASKRTFKVRWQPKTMKLLWDLHETAVETIGCSRWFTVSNLNITHHFTNYQFIHCYCT